MDSPRSRQRFSDSRTRLGSTLPGEAAPASANRSIPGASPPVAEHALPQAPTLLSRR